MAELLVTSVSVSTGSNTAIIWSNRSYTDFWYNGSSSIYVLV